MNNNKTDQNAENKLVSVIIPVYNAEKYLDQCVQSVLNQTYTNIEVILVDDGSTDSSSQLCDNYSVQDKRVHVIHQKNARIGAARNAGIEASTGDFITFIDSDDFIDLNTYATAMQLIKKYDADMVQWDLTFLPETGCKDIIENREESEYKELVLDSVESLRKLFEWKNMDSDFNNMWTATHCIWTKLLKREVLGDIRFPVGKEYEDEMILHRVIKNSNITVFINERFSTYRLRASSTVHTMPLSGRLDKIDAFMDRYNMITDMKEESLMSGITHDCLAGIYYCYLEANRQNETAICTDIKNKTSCILQNSKKYVSKADYYIGVLLTKTPLLFVLAFGMYNRLKHGR